LLILILISCSNAGKKSTESKVDDEFESETDSTKTDLTNYTREWLEYNYVNKNILERFEIYISDKNDTIGFQKLVFKNNKLDTTQSTFYDLKADFLKDSTLRGSLKVYLEDDIKIKSPLIQKEIKLSFAQNYNNKREIVEFKSVNSNYIDFEFKNNSDTLMGLLILHRQFDTIVDDEEMVRFIETMIPVDNKVQTDNVFIHAFELNKNER
jgi:hypothetical protein